MIGNAAARFDQSGNLTDETMREHIRKQLAAMVTWTQRLRPTLTA